MEDIIIYPKAGDTNPPPKILKRYTKLSNLKNILLNRTLSFSNPDFWYDKNDTELINIYKKKTGIQNLFVLCFASGPETIHFWETYAGGDSGCCINFNAEYLLKLFNRHNLRHGYVQYEEIKYLPQLELSVNNIPFMKRWPYRIEEEYRVFYFADDNTKKYEIDIDLKECLHKIVLSPDVPKSVLDKLKKQLKNITNKTTHHTTVLKNKNWIKHFRSIE